MSDYLLDYHLKIPLVKKLSVGRLHCLFVTTLAISHSHYDDKCDVSVGTHKKLLTVMRNLLGEFVTI